MSTDLIPTETCSAVCSNLFSLRNYLEVPAASRPEYSKACPSVRDALHYLISSLEENWRASKMTLGFPGGSDGKESACSAGDLGSIPGLWRVKILWRREWQPTPAFLPENSTDRGSLQSMGSQKVGYDWVTNTFTFQNGMRLQIKHANTQLILQ